MFRKIALERLASLIGILGQILMCPSSPLFHFIKPHSLETSITIHLALDLKISVMSSVNMIFS